jgi:hypothetical protein
VADTLDAVVGDLSNVASEFVPRFVGALVVLVVALVVALVLRRMVARFLETVGLDELFERTGASNSLWQLGYDGGPSRLLGHVILWGVMLTGVAGALSVLGLSSLEHTMDQIVNLSGRALVALVIIIAGVMGAGWLAELVARESESAGLRGGRASGARSLSSWSPSPASSPPDSSASRPPFWSSSPSSSSPPSASSPPWRWAAASSGSPATSPPAATSAKA